MNSLFRQPLIKYNKDKTQNTNPLALKAGI